MKVKICGLRREQDVKLCVDLGAWAVGFVFAKASPRRLDLDQAAVLRRHVPKGVLAVGVFEDALATEIAAAVAHCGLDAVQLHGAWPSFLEDAPHVAIFRALELRQSRPIPSVSSRAAALLVEPRRGPKARQAGRGPSLAEQRWVWAQAADLAAQGRKVILAGGLNPANVAEAVAAARPDAVDVSGGVESAFGVKDPAKLRAFFKTAGALS